MRVTVAKITAAAVAVATMAIGSTDSYVYGQGNNGTTADPTAAPTTVAPTVAPTVLPTTIAPTVAPTVLPTTIAPTVAPTGLPTTIAPSTIAPTVAPTTVAPTVNPATTAPTAPVPGPTPSGEAGGLSRQCDGKFVPFPGWSGLLVSSLVFNSIGVLSGLLGAAFLAKFWNRPIINMSQKLFLTFFCIGVALLNAGMMVLVLAQNNPSSNSCMGGFGTIELSLAFLISSLGMKEWRAWKVRLQSLRFQRVKIGNNVLYGYILAAMVVMIAILTTWFATNPPMPDPCQMYKCSFDTIFFVSWGYLVILMLGTTIMAFIARDVPSVGAESSSILYTSIFMLFCMVFLIMVFGVASLGTDLQMWLLSFVVMWISLCYMLLIVFRKYAWVSRSKEEINAMFLSENRHSSTFYGAGATSNTNISSKKLGASTAVSSAHCQLQGPHEDNLNQDGNNEISHDKAYDIETFSESPPQSPRGKIKALNCSPNGLVEHSPDTPSALNPTRTQPSTNDHDSALINFGREDQFGCPRDEDSQKTVDIEALKQTAFKIAEKDGWQEFVDRNSGDSFWIQTSTNTVSYTSPAVFVIPV